MPIGEPTPKNHRYSTSKLSAAKSQTYGQTESDTFLLARLEEIESQLAAERLRNRAIINSLGEGLIATDREGRIITVNPYVQSALGYDEDELLGQWFPRAIVAVDHNYRKVDPLRRPIIQALSQGRHISEYIHYLCKDKSLLPVLVTVSPILIDNKPMGAIEVFRDIAKEKAFDLAKDEFVSLASHQLRTPATGVKAILSMLGNGDFGELSPKQAGYIEKALQANSRQLEIIEDLLNVARIDSGNIEMEFTDANMTSLVKDVVAEQMDEIKARKQNLSIIAPDQATAWVDPKTIRMVIENLISNASKYTPDAGAVAVTIKPDPDCLKLVVEDNGVGIPKQFFSRLFEKFSRVENELSAPAGGTGLGLYIVKSIIDLHHGTIDLDSTPGKGTHITIALPASTKAG